MILLYVKALWSAAFPPMVPLARIEEIVDKMTAELTALAKTADDELEAERERIRGILATEREAHIAQLSTMIDKEWAVEIIERTMRTHADESEALVDLRLGALQDENDATLDDLNLTIRQARVSFEQTLLVAATRGSAIVAEAPGLSPADRRSLLDVFRQMHAGAVKA